MATVQTTPHPTCTPLANEALPKSGFFKRLSQWLWSVAYYDFTEGNEFYNNTGDYVVEVIPEQQETTNKPCKRCRMEGIACDRVLPHCSLCQHEQVLCFYVDPPRVTRKKKRKQSATESEVS